MEEEDEEEMEEWPHSLSQRTWHGFTSYFVRVNYEHATSERISPPEHTQTDRHAEETFEAIGNH